MILDIDGLRHFSIENHYFDTEDHFLFTNHVNGKQNRIKIRYRTYVESNRTFLEIKYKNNKKRVIKYREPQGQFNERINGALKKTALETFNIDTDRLHSKLKVSYHRITLLHKNIPEKVTLDYELYFENSINENRLERLVVAEVKFPGKNQNSRFANIVKEYGIKPASFSKYCIGTVLTVPEVKYNRLKSKLISIRKICKSNVGAK